MTRHMKADMSRRGGTSSRTEDSESKPTTYIYIGKWLQNLMIRPSKDSDVYEGILPCKVQSYVNCCKSVYDPTETKQYGEI